MSHPFGKPSDVLEAAADAFNAVHPPGATVRVYDKPPPPINPHKRRATAEHKGRNRKRVVAAPGACARDDGVYVALETEPGAEPEFVSIKCVRWNQ